MRSVSFKKILLAIMVLFTALSVFSPSAKAVDVLETEKQELSRNEIEGILLMREEEKLARDVYLTLGEKWDLKPFFNIAESEQKHMDEMGSLVTKYDLEDPVKDDTRGIFTNPEMKKLYDELLAEGQKSRLDALKTGALIEDLDIADLEALLKETDNDDIRIVYLNLVKGSRNHLRTFHFQVERSGGTYKAQYITDDMYNKITGSQKEQYEISDPDFKYEY